jgi:hypothetical protein
MQCALSIILRLRRLITIVLGELDPPLPQCASGDWFNPRGKLAVSSLIEDRGEKLFVTSEDNIKFEAPSDKVTNDLDLADLVAKQDAQSQQSLAQYKEQMEAYRATKEKEIPIYDQPLAAKAR